MTTVRLVAAMGLAVIGASASASVASSQDTTRVQVGDFSLLRSVDFLTDSITYRWARAGDEMPSPFAFLRAIAGSRDIRGYKTLELKCDEGPLEVILHFRPAYTATPGGRTFSPGEAQPVPVLSQLAPVQLRFDTDPPEPPSEWLVRPYSASMPSSEVPSFVEKSRPAIRLRARVGPYARTRIGDVDVMGQEELEFSLRGYSRSLELLNCPSP